MPDPILLDAIGRDPTSAATFWSPLLFPRAVLDREVARLSDALRPANGRRETLLVHPAAPPDCPSLAPGIRVTLSVLLPGEQTEPVRQNSTAVCFCIAGEGTRVVGEDRVPFGRYDVWNLPAWRGHWHENSGETVQVLLTYSNAPVLERLCVHLCESVNPGDVTAPDPTAEADPTEADDARRSPFGTFPLGDSGALLMPYETLISPPSVVSSALHWRWDDVKHHLDQLDALGAEYVGRRLYLLYNSMTGRTNGTTPSFFTTITIRPPGIADRPHRHISAAINYFFQGRGWSKIDGRRYEWAAGDLMLTAPGWAIHGHASHEGEPVYEMTVQDQPFHIANESLLWQEDLAHPPRILGSEAGFGTNRERVGV